jgi:hypothetical protein
MDCAYLLVVAHRHLLGLTSEAATTSLACGAAAAQHKLQHHVSSRRANPLLSGADGQDGCVSPDDNHV